jgi:hypothetical protein
VSGRNDGYLFIDLREYTENYIEDKKIKDPRFIILNAVTCAKLLLLDPKVCMPENLQKLGIFSYYSRDNAKVQTN